MLEFATSSITRRFMLGGLGSLLSTTVLAKPEALHDRHGHSNPSLPGPGLSVRLDFADGKSLILAQSQATDIGDYVGPFVHQKCFRQIASGNGDYRDAFLVDFRPDVDGKHQEVVIEFGTLFKFPVGSAPQTASGIAPVHLGLPPAPVLTKTTGSTSNQVGLLQVFVNYVTPDGETPGSESSVALKIGERVVVKSPLPSMNATRYNVYATLHGVTPGNARVLQNTQPISLGVDWTEPATGVLMTGKAQPFVRPPTIAYRVTISGGTLPAPVTVPVPVHYWRTRHRWQSAPRPIVRALADLVAMKAVLPLTKPYAYGAKLRALRAWAGPMDNGPILTGMSAPGGRPDIGFMTEWSASYLVTLDANCETTMRAAAEATGTIAYWTRDAATGALLDTSAVSRYPAYSDALHGPQAIPSVPGGLSSWSYIYPNQSHMPTAAFVPWLLTDDPYYLEGAQATANYGIMESNLNRNAEKTPSLGSVVSPRAWAWGLRDIFQMAGFSLDVTPKWLLPRSYWNDKVRPAQLPYAMKFVNATASPATTVFHLIPYTNAIPAFMLEYICIVMGWIKWTGKFPEFDPIVEYAATPRIVMSDPNNTLGWDHRQPSPYYMPVIDARKGAAATATPQTGYNAAANPNTPTSWAELWQDYLLMAPSKKWPADPNTWPADGYPVHNGYEPWWRASLAALSLAGLKGAREGHDWTAKQLAKYNPYASNGYTWAIPPE